MAGFASKVLKVTMQGLDPNLTNFIQEPILPFQTDPATAQLWDAEIINPLQLGFLPQTGWDAKIYSLRTIRDSYFSKKNNVNRRFENKLWNALRITSVYPQLAPIVGVIWVNNNIFKVYKHAFAYLLGINAIDGGLFHKQGNFTRHGFRELTEYEAKEILKPEQLEGVDYKDVKLLTQSYGYFNANSTENTISQCRWVNPTTASRVAVYATLPPIN